MLYVEKLSSAFQIPGDAHHVHVSRVTPNKSQKIRWAYILESYSPPEQGL
jgi:hypothetical protein